MELPFEKKEKTLAELKEKGIKWRTEYYCLTNPEHLNHFVTEMEKTANNPLKYMVIEFEYVPLVDGTPCVMIRYKDDEKVNDVKTKKYSIWAKLHTHLELKDLDEIINKHDKTTLYLLGEKRFTMKTGDFFILLIWATIDVPVKHTEGLDVLRQYFAAKFR